MAAGHRSPPTNNRTIDRNLDEAQSTGNLDLSSRKLNEFPKSAESYDLSDTVEAGKLSTRVGHLLFVQLCPSLKCSSQYVLTITHRTNTAVQAIVLELHRKAWTSNKSVACLALLSFNYHSKWVC